MVKICTQCHYVNAGGFRCSECEGRLIMVTDDEAKDLPPEVWKNQRVDYGARRGMVFRFMGIFIGCLSGLYLLREAMALEHPWSIVASIGSVLIGIAIWRFFHNAATRAVRVWVLAKGKVRRGRLARAIVLSMLPMKRRKRAARS